MCEVCGSTFERQKGMSFTKLCSETCQQERKQVYYRRAATRRKAREPRERVAQEGQIIRRGEDSPVAKLTDAAVLDMRYRYACGCDYRELAKEYKVSASTAINVLRHRSWPHLGGPVATSVRVPRKVRKPKEAKLPDRATCPWCEKGFQPATGQQRYCGSRCRLRAQGRRADVVWKASQRVKRVKHTPIHKECAECHTPFSTSFGHDGKKFCSVGCHKKSRKRRERRERNKIPHQIAKRSLSLRIRELLRRKGVVKEHPTMKYTGCSLEGLRRHLESRFTEVMSWNNYGQNGWHIDHILPCAAFDLTKEEHQMVCFNYRNLQPLWHTDNIEKSDKIRPELADPWIVGKALALGLTLGIYDPFEL